VAQAPVWVAKERGIFDKYGLDVDLSYVATSSTLVPSMLAGEIAIAAGAEDAVISAGLGGADVVMIASGPTHLLFSIYAPSSIQGLSDLKGKRLGVTRFGSATDFSARYVLSRNNLRPGDDVATIQMGGVPEIFAGLQAGAIDAGVLSPPTSFLARDAGMKELLDISKQDVEFYQGPLLARRAWLKDNREVAVRFVKAYIEAIATMKKDPAQAQEVVSKYTGDTDARILEQSVAAVLPILPLDQTPSLDAVRTGLQQSALNNPDAANADPNQFLDQSIVKDIISSGFLNTLGQ